MQNEPPQPPRQRRCGGGDTRRASGARRHLSRPSARPARPNSEARAAFDRCAAEWRDAVAERDAKLAPDRRLVELWDRRQPLARPDLSDDEIAAAQPQLEAIETEMIASAPALVAGMLIKIRILAEYLLPLDPADDDLNRRFLRSLLADAERLAPEPWPEDYGPIPAA